MAHSLSDYVELLKQLLPPGQAFPRESGTNLERLLQGMAAELVRAEERADRLPFEANPQTTSELLTEWESTAGLPDRCSGVLEDTLQGRRQALIAKLASTGGQSVAYFVEVAAKLGYEISIEEFRPFQAGRSVAGDALTNGDWIFSWKVNAPETTIISFRAGVSAAGEPLRSWGNEALECKINQLKPAQTHVIFSYGSEQAEEAYQAADRLFYVANYLLPQKLVVPNE